MAACSFSFSAWVIPRNCHAYENKTKQNEMKQNKTPTKQTKTQTNTRNKQTNTKQTVNNAKRSRLLAILVSSAVMPCGEQA